MNDETDAGGRIPCLLCDEGSDTLAAHEQHMRAVHDDLWVGGDLT